MLSRVSLYRKKILFRTQWHKVRKGLLITVQIKRVKKDYIGSKANQMITQRLVEKIRVLRKITQIKCASHLRVFLKKCFVSDKRSIYERYPLKQFRKNQHRKSKYPLSAKAKASRLKITLKRPCRSTYLPRQVQRNLNH